MQATNTKKDGKKYPNVQYSRKKHTVYGKVDDQKENYNDVVVYTVQMNIYIAGGTTNTIKVSANLAEPDRIMISEV